MCCRRGFLQVGSPCVCAAYSREGSAALVWGARSLIIGVNSTPGRVRQGHADPGVRGRAYDEGRLVGRQMGQCSLRWWRYWGDLWWLAPDGKTQVTIEHVQRVGEIVAGTNSDLWCLAPDGRTQVMIEHVTDACKNGDLWWVRPVGNMQVLRNLLEEFILKNGQMVLSLYGVTARTCTSSSQAVHLCMSSGR